MEIIISHTNLDLDGLASMLLAKKKYIQMLNWYYQEILIKMLMN